MFPYFPFPDDQFKMSMGVQALGNHRLIEVDPDCYRAELALKNRLLAEEYSEYFRAAPGSENLQWEVLELLLPRMAADYRDHFSLTRDGERWTWRNTLLSSETTFRSGDGSSLELPPLDWLGRQVQEDLLLLSGADDLSLLAGQLCFPNNWSLDDKMGKSFLAIHDEVPLFAARIGRPSQLLLERLKAGRSVWRVNWSLKTSPQLNQIFHLPHAPQQAGIDSSLTDSNLTNGGLLELTPENIGERCYLRVERQTLSRLPRTNGILFTIHTYQSPLAALITSPEHTRRILGTLHSTPIEILNYKGITPFLHPLLAYMQTHI
ncbi:MAG: DUF3445 domain-containing protein [Ktedonobacteraceae bacterium]